MSEGPFRGNAAAREARLAALEAELATLRAARPPSVLDARERKRANAKIERLTADLERSRARVQRLREQLAEAEAPSGKRARVMRSILDVIMTVLVIGALAGVFVASCRAARVAADDEPNPAVSSTDYVVQQPGSPPLTQGFGFASIHA